MKLSLTLEHFKDAMLELPAGRPLGKEDLLVERFLIERSGELEMYYSPHNEYVNEAAQLVIMGLTPGWVQMRIAYEEAISALRQGLSVEEACKRAKMAARFAGPMRNNLIHFLDELELPSFLGLPSSGALFAGEESVLHTVSALRFPVFKRGMNYSGSAPQLLASPFLASWAIASIKHELKQLPQQPIIIPLGLAVESVLQMLVQEEELDSARVLWGFPHPSGANGHRKRQFEQNKSSMQGMLRHYFGRQGL